MDLLSQLSVQRSLYLEGGCQPRTEQACVSEHTRQQDESPRAEHRNYLESQWPVLSRLLSIDSGLL